MRWLLCVVLLLTSGVFAASGNKFVWAQLQYDGAWDPYPNVHEPVFAMAQTFTNIPFLPQRAVVTLKSEQLFENTFLMVKGNSALKFNEAEKNNLKEFIERGGLVFFDDTLADSHSEFSKSVRNLLKELFPSYPCRPLSLDHAVYRSFFLLRNPGGRRISEKYLEGMDLPASAGGQSRTAVLLSGNDILGAWIKDPMGNYAFSCDPGGDVQRWDTHKLTLNIIYFSLTGTYKKDAVHQPFIERKLGLEP